MSRPVDDAYAKTQTALANALRRIEAQAAQMKAMSETLEKYARLDVEIDPKTLENKRRAIERECIYGFTHFCDGTVNYSEAAAGTQPKPPCPNKRECLARKIRLV